MTLNLDKHKDSLVSAWRDVLSESSRTNWALFSYTGQTYELNCVGKGEGGLEALVDEYNSGKIMYALTRLYIPEKNCEKYVLINWQGEGVPLSFKGNSANHIQAIKNFFKVNLVIHARNEDEVDPAYILSTITKTIAGEGIKPIALSADCEADGKIGPVGTVYTKINPLSEIDQKAKEKYWQEQEEEELRRKKEEKEKMRKFSQNEVKLLRQESQTYFDNEEAETVRSPKGVSSAGVETNGKQMNGNGNGDFHNVSSADARRASMPKKNLSNESSNLVRQRIKSFDGGAPPPVPKTSFPTGPMSNSFNSVNRNIRISPGSATYTPQKVTNGLTVDTSNSNTRGKSPQRSPINGMISPVSSTASTGGDESDSGLSVSKRRAMFENGGFQSATNNYVKQNPTEEIRNAQMERSKNVPKSITTLSNPAAKEMSPPRGTQVQEPIQNNVAPAKSYNYNYKINSPPSQTPPPSFTNNVVAPAKNELQVAPQEIKSATSPKSPKSPNPINNHIYHQEEEAEVQEEHKNNGFNESELEEGEIVDDDTFEDSTVQSGIREEDFVAQSPELIGMEDRIIPGTMKRLEITEEMGCCARALYDYEPADDTEISFDPGDIITNIDKIDEGWWQGINPAGAEGLFPSNYVELLN